MRSILSHRALLLALLLAAVPAHAEDASLEILLTPQKGGALTVELIFEGSAGGETVVEVAEEWGGSTFEAGIFEDPRVLGSSTKGDAKPGERAVSMADAPHAWRLEHAPGETLRLAYAVPRNAFIHGMDGSSYYKPIVAPALVHLIGHQALLLPRSWDDDQPLDVTLRWTSLPEAWHAVSSFGLGAGPHRVSTSMENLRQGLFVAGKGELFEGEAKDPVHVFLAEGPWRFEGAELASLARQIVHAEREFFAGEAEEKAEESDPFAITVIAIGPESPDHLSYGGTGLERAFATFLVPVVTMDGPDRSRLLSLLAHEKAHTWVGGLIASGEEPEPAGYWFSEGFTEYLTPRLLHRAGLATPQDVIDAWNERLGEYFLSPAFEASNAEIASDFWNDRDLEQLAYARGAAVALYLDHVRRRRDGGRLEAMLFPELEKAREEGRKRTLTNAELRRLVESGWTASETETAFATLLDGRRLELPADLLEPCATLSWQEETTFQLGFEHDPETGKILNVEKGTNAWLVGLRRGQGLSGWSIRYGDPKIEVVLQRQVEDGKVEDSTREIRFLPAGAKRQVPRFEIADAKACAVIF